MSESVEQITLRQAAQKWMDEHPQEMALFSKFAGEMLRVRRRFGFRLLSERVRWEGMMGPKGDAEFKLNDHYTPYIARALIHQMPGLADLIETRVVKAADLPERKPIRGQTVDPFTEEPIKWGI